ncbi:MAG: isoprenylcysteine carboxylmethyltransferase family protein [Rhizobium sp.]|nr:isoprenylcysteine carboxylmethyltransferase family protein [Rhizobium sp.]
MNAYRTKPLRYPWPPVIYGGAVAFALVGERLAPMPLTAPGPLILPVLGFALALLAISLDIWAVKTLMERQTAVLGTGGARYLVTCGPFRFTRNPIYLGYTLLTLSLGLIAASAWFVPMALMAAAIIDWTVIRCEEQHLDQRFGYEYECYRRRTRRWI